LNNLLKGLLNLENTKKTEINDMMKENAEFWYERPLKRVMLEYAAQDVIYLPEVYEKFKEIITASQRAAIFQTSANFIYYSMINRDIHEFTALKEGDLIGSYIKNFYGKLIFCSLNLGCTGIVKNKNSCQYLKDNFDMGDLINLEVER